MPSFALGAGEEPEIAGVYIVDDSGAPWRIGFALANDFSDHITERKNYMYIAHSKLRQCPIGPELLVGELPPDIRGESRLLRGGNVDLARRVRQRRVEHVRTRSPTSSITTSSTRRSAGPATCTSICSAVRS